MTTGNRQRLPENALGCCASCGAKRGNRTKDWTRIYRAKHHVAWTCPTCPLHSEPIRLDGARFLATTRDRDGRQVKARHDSLTEARSWLAEVKEGRHVKRTETVEQLIERWLASRHDVRQVTVESYRYALAPVIRRIGQRKATAVTADDMHALVVWLTESGGRPTTAHPNGRPLGPRSVELALVGLGQAFDLLDQPVNPVRSVRAPRKVKRDVQHWTPADMQRFQEHADHDPLAGAWRLTLAGLTRADVLGLRWSDVDLDAGTVEIRQGRVAVKGGRETVTDEPKSDQRRRVIEVEDALPGSVAALRTLRSKQAEARLRAGSARQDTGLVIVSEVGQPIRTEAYSDRFRALCVAAGVPTIRLHSVRHSLAFRLHSLGATPADAAAFLGHTVAVHLAAYLPASGNAGAARSSAALGQAHGQAIAE